MLSKRHSYSTASLFFEKFIFRGLKIEYTEDDYFLGKYYASVWEEFSQPEITEAEIEACERFISLIFSPEGRKLSAAEFDERLVLSRYVYEKDYLGLSQNLEGFLHILKNSSIDEVLFMNYMRVDSLKRVHKACGYFDLLYKLEASLEGHISRDQNLVAKKYFKVTEEQWLEIARIEFMKEALTWKVVLQSLKEEGHYFDNLSEHFNIDMVDLDILKKFFLYQAVKEIHLSRVERKITLLGCLVFEY